MLKKILGVISMFSILIMLFTLTAYAILSHSLTSNTTHNTYMNASSSFSTTYLTLAQPTLEYRYRNLKCDSTSATLNTKIYAYKVHWYNIVGPSETLIGTSAQQD